MLVYQIRSQRRAAGVFTACLNGKSDFPVQLRLKLSRTITYYRAFWRAYTANQVHRAGLLYTMPRLPVKILVVDDNLSASYLLKRFLDRQGYEVITAANGVEGLAALRQSDIGLIISDIHMPAMDGFQLCREVKSDARLQNIPFIFCTALYTDYKDEAFALSLGAVRYIVKPFELQPFLQVIQELLHTQGSTTPVRPFPGLAAEPVFLKEYSERLVKKLEEKMLELEALNAQLSESELKYRELVENAYDAVLVLGLDGKVNFANSKFRTLTEYAPAEVLQLNISQLVHPQDLGLFAEQTFPLLTNLETGAECTFRLLTRGGQTREIDGRFSLLARQQEIVGLQAIFRDITEYKRKEAELSASRHIHALIEAEHKRIAIEVHDQLGGNLVGIMHGLELTLQTITTQEHTAAVRAIVPTLQDLIGLTTKTIEAARTIAEEMRPAELELLGLIPALKSEAQKFSARTGIANLWEYASEEPPLTEEQGLAVFRIFQEALRNIHRHAEATQFRVRVTEVAQACVIEIQDNGRGINQAEQVARASLGMLGMRARAERIGGHVRINSHPGQGTTVAIAVPLLRPGKSAQADAAPGLAVGIGEVRSQNAEQNPLRG